MGKRLASRAHGLCQWVFCLLTGKLWLYRNRYLRMDANVRVSDPLRRQFHIDRYEFARETLKASGRGDLVLLDAACGTGYGSHILRKLRPRQITGVDISPEAVRYADGKYGDECCRFMVADVLIMEEFKDETFDAVVSFETIEHLAEPLIFLRTIHRLLKTKGILIISTPNKWGPTRDHKFDYDYDLFQDHLARFFEIDAIYVQNSGSMDLWVNRGCPRRLVKSDPSNVGQAECFIAVCRKIR